MLSWFKSPGVDKGDVDGNGAINILDVLRSATIILGTYQPGEEELARSDLNYDGRVDILDAVFIVNIILGG